ncbi:quinolinate synthase NadA [Novosphingobium aerophilum]|uniref:quinolinate synthase NadA n=1 Tax=Novosphingobium TaxID=165696 RepID=UPI0006C872E4|nr:MULTISPECIES: quinolinate synthase NadA [unclassified Novosphingobium]KPH60250.1 quinolinate synthetase [Novosphingobium sp. ST904]MPS68539.1 quinolinate synthase NadA [Novosphingobium sp.]TCM36868.1 quinolinate synthetase [Novosphingobium sp. ST904]WRT93877.1 quinolinate synthase NadA [Novosphingobium sp. RL4]
MTVMPADLSGIDVRAEIERLRKERNAVILAHYYQRPELQDIADFVGDSLELSRKAAETDAEVIAFCGVKFMAETAKILSPNKIVVLPDLEAGCSLEDSCPPEKFKAFREAHPDHIALTYINCSTEVKALSDIIVTSSSAETILQQIPADQKIIFGPDRHLGGYLSRKFDREMLLWPGVCIVHEAFSETELLKLKAQHPTAPIAAHPECPPHIVDHADYVGSTSGILQYAKTIPGDTLIVATEPHIIHQMQLAIPNKTFIGAPGADGNCNCNICPYMALNTMEKLYVALRDLEPRIEIEEQLRLDAKRSLDRMLEMASGTVGKGDLGTR